MAFGTPPIKIKPPKVSAFKPPVNKNGTINAIAPTATSGISAGTKVEGYSAKKASYSEALEIFKEASKVMSVEDFEVLAQEVLSEILKEAKIERIPLTEHETAEVKLRFGDSSQCSFAKDKDGIYAYTHRARGHSYKDVASIPEKEVKFIESTS